jgi:hypothetical protein
MFRRKRTEAFLLASALAGCGTLFGIDPPERAEPPFGIDSGNGGASGRGTSGGASGGGTGGTILPEGGAGMAGDGGEVAMGGTGANATGGRGGVAGTAGSSGAGGAGGEGGDDEFPSKGEPCPTPGALACAGEAQKRRLICQGGVWTPDPVQCDYSQNCDRRNGACADIEGNCEDVQLGYHWLECPEFGTIAKSCGPDLVTIVEEECYFGCNIRTRQCAEPSAGELLVDRVPPTQNDFVFWPTPVIPVCFGGEGNDSERAAIRDEVESTWGRYSSIAFSGWGDCTNALPEPAEVRISFLNDACVGELASISRYGYPGPGATLDLAICKSYVDANGATLDADDAMLRYVARHLFGHVLGREHVSWDFMRPVLSPSTISERVFGELAIEDLQLTYGGKPSGSLVNASGRCVGSSKGGAVDVHVCDGSNETRWQALEGRLVAEGGMRCLHASGSDSASLEPCEPTPEFVWETNDVQWRGNGGRCVARSTTASSGASLVLETCRALGDADQTWSFEFYPARRVRIRGPNGDCIHIPEPVAMPPLYPELARCDGVRDELEMTTSAQLGLSGYCMTERYDVFTYELQLAPCRARPAQSFYLSGPLGHYAGPDEQTVLTLLPTGQLGAATLEGAPSQAQIFDYHF